jgi:phage shock protein PspC (stress-responsive transcriptional regulator)
MKKVININFQGRVIPIEDSAYEILKQYTDSLRQFFANEEGRDEIINDIETRIAELFAENLKKGATCITDEHVEVIINSMGRPEDFEAEEINVESQLKSERQKQSSEENSNQYRRYKPNGRLYRDEKDKILGGVCAGIAHYFKLDPSVVRIVFALISIGGFGTGFLLYVVLWTFLPKTALSHNEVKSRLFRNPDDKIFAGVAGGIAAYFDINSWIPRVIFALPLIGSFVNFVFRHSLFNDHDFGRFINISFNSTFFVIYGILWAVIPEARSSTEKMEMRGKKVDLEAIRNSVQEELGGVKERAERWGEQFRKDHGKAWSENVSQRASEFGRSFSSSASQVAGEFQTSVRSTGNKLGHALGVILKSVVLFLGAIAAIALLTGLLGFIFGDGYNFINLKDYFLTSQYEELLFWTTLSLGILLPIVGLFLWIIRRIVKAKKPNPYINWTMSGLWTLGFVSFILLAANISRQFKRRGGITEAVNIAQPSGTKLIINRQPVDYEAFDNDWWGIHWDNDEENTLLDLKKDSVKLGAVRLKIVKSNDAQYHVYVLKLSRGGSRETARRNAEAIRFNIEQRDSVLTLDAGITITTRQKFRNQQVMVIVEVPEGKKLEIDPDMSHYRWGSFDNDYAVRKSGDLNWHSNWDNDLDWNTTEEYIMTDGRLKAVRQPKEQPDNKEEEENDEDIENYRNSRRQLKEKRDQKLREFQEYDKELKDSLNVKPPAKVERRADGTAKLTGKPDANDTGLLRSGWMMTRPVI